MLPSSPQAPRQLPLQRVDLHSSHATARALLSSSPQPSPGLPSNLPRQGERQLKFNGGGILRLLTWLIVCTLLSWAATRIVHSDRKLNGNKRCVFWPSSISRGRNWTISIPLRSSREIPLPWLRTSAVKRHKQRKLTHFPNTDRIG